MLNLILNGLILTGDRWRADNAVRSRPGRNRRGKRGTNPPTWPKFAQESAESGISCGKKATSRHRNAGCASKLWNYDQFQR